MNTLRKMVAITADYQERIVVAPEDVIPKSSWFKFVKCSLLTALSMLIVLAIITLIVAESFVSSKHQNGMAIGIVSLVGIILFLLGMVAILKEHIPLVLTFSVAMIIYLLLFMYSRVITSPGLIILRTFILLLLALEAFLFCIMIRDWRAIQVSRINQRMMKEAQLAQYAAANGMMPPSGHLMSTGYGFMSQQPYGPAQRTPYAHMQQQQQQMMGHQLMSQTTRGYPEEMRHYQSQQQYGHTAAHNYSRGRAQQPGLNQYGPNQYGPTNQYGAKQYGPTNQYGPNQYGPANLQQQQHQYDQNPYITVEDENPYAQIGEPSHRQMRATTPTPSGQVYNTPKINAPRRY